MEFDLENPFTHFHDNNNNNDTDYPSLFYVESDHMVSENYSRSHEIMDFHVPLRRQTISLILQFSGSFDPRLPYLAINYLDRFFSSQGMPQAKPWMVRLLAIACVSLAAKMMKTEFGPRDIQFGEGFIFDSLTTERMELLILGALNWRVRSITPLSFLHFFISLFKLSDPPSRQALKARALEIIFKAQNETQLLEFKPSIVAASALLSASHELFPTQCPCFRKAISACSYVNKESLSSCCKVMQGILMEDYEPAFAVGGGGGAATSSSDTEVNVLDQHWSSSAVSELSIDPNSNHPGPGDHREAVRQRKTGGFSPPKYASDLSHSTLCG
ncbi:hypothetical protein Nepgr_014442 [Nepenthes gracilis]|uniref:Cyclin-D6-1 n=1 Tax=Nepenthes gracilis TaxID=150966 RepID=A0AAD3XQA8_NEPGR|nr:hypothetical protein Nepgr_014442 [Nepenthes gracilis]